MSQLNGDRSRSNRIRKARTHARSRIRGLRAVIKLKGIRTEDPRMPGAK